MNSAVGGLWYGRSWRGPGRRHLPVTPAGFACGLAAVALVLDGTAAPPRTGGSEAQGWLHTALTSGGAAGMALAVLVAAPVAVVAQRWWKPGGDRVARYSACPLPSGSQDSGRE